MRPSAPLLPAALLLVVAGCGTVYNLKDPPPQEARGPQDGPGHTFPFGGAYRSCLLGIYGAPVGLCELLNDKPAEAGKWFSLGVLAWADVPLSVAGDVVTLPVAYGRYKGEPWATWWGEGSGDKTDGADAPGLSAGGPARAEHEAVRPAGSQRPAGAGLLGDRPADGPELIRPLPAPGRPCPWDAPG